MINNKKALILDFDGTLTEPNSNVWKECWKATGFNLEGRHLYQRLYAGFISKKINYETWNFLTCVVFRSRNFSIDKLNEISKNIVLKPGINEFVNVLKQNNFDLFIVSGGIRQTIESVLKNRLNDFSFIGANRFIFDEKGIIKQIKCTKFDNEGKADFVNLLISKKGYKRQNITFIGNSFNDEHVYKTGVKTICITPQDANHQNKKIWNECVEKVENLTALLPYLIKKNNNYNEKIEL